MGAPFDTITFLSDYGTGDEFVGVVKSVIRPIAPHVTVIDLTHDIPPYDVRAGGLTLGRAGPVPVPGCGARGRRPRRRHRAPRRRRRGRRRPELPRRPGQRPARRGGRHERRGHRRGRAHQPRVPARGARPTFAGRDVFAPAAAHLCAACRSPTSGARSTRCRCSRACCRSAREEDGALVAEVLWVDRYGNCQLNVDPDEVAAFGPRVQLRWGDDVAHRRPGPHLRGDPRRPGRPGDRQLRDAVGLPRPALGRRRAAHRRRHRGDAARADRRRADVTVAPPVTLTPRSDA